MCRLALLTPCMSKNIVSLAHKACKSRCMDSVGSLLDAGTDPSVSACGNFLTPVRGTCFGHQTVNCIVLSRARCLRCLCVELRMQLILMASVASFSRQMLIFCDVVSTTTPMVLQLYDGAIDAEIEAKPHTAKTTSPKISIQTYAIYKNRANAASRK